MRTAWRMIVLLVVIAALAAAPLFLVYRSRCLEDGKRVNSWSVVLPWNDPPSDCRKNQHGLDVLKEEIEF